ncbi:MAG: DUF4097 family beta strand repeat-containing protein [Rubricoccaceae bacterium]|nr:DUF4097 family beta strand repeat-containing protein [Rubricoccaceae bacterium]
MLFTRRTFQRIALATIVVCVVAILVPKLVEADRDDTTRVASERADARSDYHQQAHQTSDVRANRHDEIFLDRSFNVSAGDYLKVELASSDVIVNTGSGTAAQVIVRGRGDDAAEEFERRRFAATYNNGTLHVRTDPERRPRNRRIEASFTVEISIPQRFDVQIATASGDVQMGNLSGQLDIRTASGDVQIGSVDGTELDIATASGDVYAEALTGILDITTASGDVSVQRISGHSVSVSTASGDVFSDHLQAGRLEIQTASGDIEIDHVDAEGSVQTASGDVHMDLDVLTAWSIQTAGGDVGLALPHNAGASVNLSSSDIEIDGSLGFNGTRNRREARGTIGSGGPALNISTHGGSIELEVD